MKRRLIPPTERIPPLHASSLAFRTFIHETWGSSVSLSHSSISSLSKSAGYHPVNPVHSTPRSVSNSPTSAQASMVFRRLHRSQYLSQRGSQFPFYLPSTPFPPCSLRDPAKMQTHHAYPLLQNPFCPE